MGAQVWPRSALRTFQQNSTFGSPGSPRETCAPDRSSALLDYVVLVKPRG
ncbi:MAG: hypothetical protein JO250_18775 [Armatimonadetes bacterium]|nr:hypothetical protein [Armatimonadota bacterium]